MRRAGSLKDDHALTQGKRPGPRQVAVALPALAVEGQLVEVRARAIELENQLACFESQDVKRGLFAFSGKETPRFEGD